MSQHEDTNPTSSPESALSTPHGQASQPPESDHSGVRERVADATRDVASKAKRQAETVYRAGSSAAAGTSDALDDAADALASSGHESLSQAAAALSDQARKFSNYLEDRRLEDLIGDARHLAQRNPALFVAGGVVLGFALSRFLKASAANVSRTTRVS